MFESKLDAMAREKVERTINAMPDAEADEIANAAGYERRTGRKAFRAGHYGRTLAAKAGKLSLKAPELKGALFGSAVIERCRRRESSVEEALMEMCLAGVSTRGVDDTGRLGRARGERGRPRRHRRRHGGPARGHRGRRGHARGRGRPGAVLPKHDRTRVEGRRTGGRRPVRRTRLHGQLDAAERGIPAAHGAFHARRALQDAARSQGMGVRRPEGRLRAGKPRIRHGQGRDGRGRNGGTQAQGGREPPARGRRRDRRLPPAGVPREPWDQAAHERHDRAIEQGDPPAHPGRGRLPRLRQRAHARMRRNPLRHLTLVVGPAIHGHVPAR